MKIGLYHEGAGRMQAGGISVFVQEMAIELAETNETYLVTGDGPVVDFLERSAVEVVQVPGAVPDDGLTRTLQQVTPFRDQLSRKLLTVARAERAGVFDWIDDELDLVLTHQYLDDLLLSRALSVPTLFEYHGVQKVGLGSRIRERFSATDWTIANSRHTANVVDRSFGRQVDGVVRPGVDTSQFRPGAPPAFESDEVSVLFVGRFVEAKGVFDLLEAVARMDSSVSVHLVGRDDVSALQERIASLGLSDAVTVHDPVAHGDIHRYFAACDVFCNPSHYESFGMVNLEAMACGVPVVTTDSGGITEYASDGDDAVLVSPGDVDALARELDSLATHAGRRRRLGRKARETALEYDWTSQRRELEAVCSRLLAGNPPMTT